MSETSTQNIIGAPLRRIPTVREVMDEEWMTRGDGDGKIWTREELEIHHRIGDLISELMGEEYPEDKFDEELQRRMLRAGLAEPSTKQTKPRTRQKRTAPRAELNKTS